MLTGWVVDHSKHASLYLERQEINNKKIFLCVIGVGINIPFVPACARVVWKTREGSRRWWYLRRLLLLLAVVGAELALAAWWCVGDARFRSGYSRSERGR